MERSQLFDLMGELKLYGMKAAFDEIMATAVKRQYEPQRIIGDLLTAEVNEKQARSIKYQLTIAKLPLAKDLDDFRFEDTPINETLVRDLAGGDFIAQQRNAVLIGGTGTGKTHLAIAIARSCIRSGTRGRFYNVVDLVNRLETETRNGRQGRIADQLTRIDDRSYGITEPEMVRMITDFAKQQHPELTDAVAFSRIYCDSSEAGVILRKAVQITKNAAYEDAVDDSEAACAELSKIGAERWPSLTKAQQFARAAETNPALLAKAHRRPSIFDAFPHPTTKAFPRVNVDGVTLKPQMVTETSPTSPEAALAQLRVLGRQKWPTASESQAFINAVTDPTNADLVRAALGPPAGSSPPRITG